MRAGFSYCRNKGDDDKKGRPAGDRCCHVTDTECMWGDVAKPKDIVCATKDAKFKADHKDQTEYFKDPYVMVQKFCMKR